MEQTYGIWSSGNSYHQTNSNQAIQFQRFSYQNFYSVRACHWIIHSKTENRIPLLWITVCSPREKTELTYTHHLGEYEHECFVELRGNMNANIKESRKMERRNAPVESSESAHGIFAIDSPWPHDSTPYMECQSWIAVATKHANVVDGVRQPSVEFF